jgi:hypothetical protein
MFDDFKLCRDLGRGGYRTAVQGEDAFDRGEIRVDVVEIEVEKERKGTIEKECNGKRSIQLTIDKQR